MGWRGRRGGRRRSPPGWVGGWRRRELAARRAAARARVAGRTGRRAGEAKAEPELGKEALVLPLWMVELVAIQPVDVAIRLVGGPVRMASVLRSRRRQRRSEL